MIITQHHPSEYKLIKNIKNQKLFRIPFTSKLPEGYVYVTYIDWKERPYDDDDKLKEKFWSIERYQDFLMKEKKEKESTIDYKTKLKLRVIAVQAEIRELKNLMEGCLCDMELKLNRQLRISGEILISDSGIDALIGDLKLDCIKWRALAIEKLKRDREIYDLNLLFESKAEEPKLFRDE